MLEERQSNAIAAAFPEPPPFWKHFTPENVARVDELREKDEQENGDGYASGQGGNLTRALRLDSLPPELRFLVPPEAPASGQYHSFGELQDLNAPLPTLVSLGFEQVYPDESALDRTTELTKLARSVLMSFLSLTDILAKNPGLYAQKIEDMRQLFANLHQLVNEYRPHQARESLIRMMEERIQGRKAEVQKIKSMEGRVQELLACLGTVDGDGDPPQDEHEEAKRHGNEVEMQSARRIWSAMDSVEV